MYLDFSIGLLLFTFTLAVYFSYTNNFQQQDSGDLDDILTDSKSISSYLSLGGYPKDWNQSNVVRIGLIDDTRLNATKLKRFKLLNYSLSKKRLGTTNDFFISFENKNGEVMNVNGICGVGHPDINTTFNVRTAYYYQDPADSFIKSLMENIFKSDIYFGDNPQNVDDIDGLISNISKYSFLIMEHPLLTASNYNNFKDELQNYSSSGNLFMLSGELATAQGIYLVGADFYKKSGQSVSDRNSTVNNTDPYLEFSVGESIVFAQAYYIENTSNAINFTQIATFNSGSANSVSKWKYGNGTVYFFSDFDVSFFNGNFTNIIEDAVKSLVEGTCSAINITVSKSKLARTERYLSHNSKVTRMVIYSWQ